MDNLSAQQPTNRQQNLDFIFEPFLNIPDLDIADLGFYHTPYSVGLIGLESVHDIDNYIAKFKFVSPPTKKIMFDYETAEFIDSRLGKEFNLTIEQKLNVARIIRDLFLGDTFIGDFANIIKTKLTVDDKIAEGIISITIAELFPPAVESLKIVQRVKFQSKIQSLSTAKQPTTSMQPSGTKPPDKLQPVTAQPPLTPVRPPMQAQPQGPTLPLQNQKPSPQTQTQQKSPQPPPKMQFKMPNLDNLPRDAEQPLNKVNDAQKSLESELEKVASVIDLRQSKK